MAQLRKYNVLTVTSLVFLVLYVISAYIYTSDIGNNKCLMTYMFESVKFVEIPVKDRSGEVYKKYRLFAYSEGKYIERACQTKFTGIPVLFIPGHGGSFKQVRSLASVTTHRTQDLQSVFHFDFFTSDFRGEYSALYGGTLKIQHEFIIRSIDKILSLYAVAKKSRPESVIIIGHSMGGMVAKSLFLNNYFNPNTVRLIITLATPHKPVLLLDREVYEFYEIVDKYWGKEKLKSSNRMENVTMISIGGGARDILVRPGITYDKYADLNVLTNAIPNVLTSTDHLCIVWCNNFVKTLSRALYDAVDFDVRGITWDKNHLKNIFHYHLIHCSNGKYYTSEIHQGRLKFSRFNTTWKEINQKQTSLRFSKGLEQETYAIMEKPEKLTDYNTIIIEAINIDKRDWIAECIPFNSAEKRLHCEDGVNLSQFAVIGFNKTLGRKYFHMGFDSTKMNKILTHLVVKLPSTKKLTGLNVDIYNNTTRSVNVTLEFYNVFSNNIVILEKTEPGAMFYSIKLHGMNSMWRVFQLSLKPILCANKKHLAFAIFKSPWNHDSTHATINWESVETLKMILLTVPPPLTNDVPFVNLILDRACQYKVEIKPSYQDSLGIIATRYSFALFANVATVLLLALTRQYYIFHQSRLCISFITALEDGRGFVLVLLAVRFLTYSWETINLNNFPFIWDTLILQREDTIDGYVVPVILYFVAFAIVYLSASLLWGLMLTCLYLHNVFLKWTCNWKNPLGGLNVRRVEGKFPLTWGMFITTIYWMSCGTVVLVFCGFMYFYKICRLYRRSLDSNTDKNGHVFQAIRTVEEDLELPRIDSVHFHTTLFLLWTLCTITYIPSLVMWYNNRGYDINNSYNSSAGFCLVLTVSISFIWYCENCPYVFLPYYGKVVKPLFITTCGLLLFCQLNIFRLPLCLVHVFVAIAMHQYYGFLIDKKYLSENLFKLKKNISNVNGASDTRNAKKTD